MALPTEDLIPLDQFTPRIWSDSGQIPECVHYACGLNLIDGWLNVDYFDDALIWNFGAMGGVPRKLAEEVYKLDLLQPHPFPDDWFAYGYCEDFIEHLSQKDAILFLSEALRTLRPGGVLRIATPGLPGVMNHHFRNARYDAVVANHDSAYTRWGHVHFFSHDSLRTVAFGLGFTGYTECRYAQSGHAELRDRETRAEQAACEINIYAELVK
jgi:SAM-dependent methyltransferase